MEPLLLEKRVLRIRSDVEWVSLKLEDGKSRGSEALDGTRSPLRRRWKTVCMHRKC